MKTTRRDFIKGSLAFGGALLFPEFTLKASEPGEKKWRPGYARLEESGELEERVDRAYRIFKDCALCPRQCGANRKNGETGFCRAPRRAMVYSVHPHFGEEISLVGNGGSGTIFFSNCNLRCVFCQNWPIAHKGQGKEVSDEQLAKLMLRLQKIGCHNVNLVTPTHVMPNILAAVGIACQNGLRIPLVYNTSGYERPEILKLLDGVVDIYLPDMKYMDSEKASKYSAGASDYPEISQIAVKEMHRQVGLHTMDKDGVALSGLMIRHLVMPNRVAGTLQFVKWVAGNLPKSTYVNIMSQYHVDYKAADHPEIARAINVDEYVEAMQWASVYGLANLDPRSILVRDRYIKSKKG